MIDELHVFSFQIDCNELDLCIINLKEIENGENVVAISFFNLDGRTFLSSLVPYTGRIRPISVDFRHDPTLTITNYIELNTQKNFNHSVLPNTVVKVGQFERSEIHSIEQLCALLDNLQPKELSGGADGPNLSVSRKQENKFDLINTAFHNGIIDADRHGHLVNSLNQPLTLSPNELQALKQVHHPITTATYHFAALELYMNHTEEPELEQTLTEKPETFKAPIHLPPVNSTYIDLHLTLPNLTAMEKEKIIGKRGYTDQFDDERPFQSLFPRHHTGDTATYWWSIQERLNFTSPGKNESTFSKKQTSILGSNLFFSFADFANIKHQLEFNQDLYITKCNENCTNRLRKSIANLMNIVERGETYWADNYAEIFIKSQILKKLEKMYSKAKAGQTLTSLHEYAIFTIGGLVRYVTTVLKSAINYQLHDLSVLPPHYLATYLQCTSNLTANKTFILGERNFDELNDFVTMNWKDVICTSNDYTKYDQSQNHEFLCFEDYIHRILGIPAWLREYYLYLKNNMQTQHGLLSVMRITGGSETYDYNTFANIGYTHLKYEIPRGMPSLFSGDDSSLNGVFKERPIFNQIGHLFLLQSKIEMNDFPIFCGWLIKNGIIKIPRLIYARLKIAEERNNLQNVIGSYAVESSYAFNYGVALIDVLEPIDILTQSYLNQFFFEHDHLVPLNFKHK
jgi:hypothetical protein